MPAPLPKEKRKLTVLSCKEIHRGTGNNGPWVMYEVEALTEAGKRIGPQTGQALRAFEVLELNKLIEYDVQPQDTDRHGRTYTLKPPRDPVWKQVNDLRGRVEDLEEKLDQLLKAQNPGPQSQDTAPPDVPAPEPAPAPSTQTW